MFELFATTFVAVGILYLPGYFLHRGFALGRFPSLVLAPVSTCFLLVCTGVVAEAIGVRCAPCVLFFICSALALVAYGVSALMRRRHSPGGGLWSCSEFGSRRIWIFAAFYTAVALGFACVVFAGNIDGPGSFSRNDDTAVHLSVVRAFLDTGTCSTLDVSSYLDLGLAGGFYPAEWHVVVAVVASLLGGAVALAFNGVTLAFIVFVFPLIVLLLLSRLFHDKHVVLAGCLFPAAFSGFPWGFLVFGQLFPNMISFMFVPAALVLLQGILEASTSLQKIKLSALLLMSLGAIVAGQPNGVFTWGIWATCFLIGWVLSGAHFHDASLKKRALCAAGIVGIACVSWVVLYQAPFLQAVVQTSWAAPLSKRAALTSGILLMFSDRQGVQLLLALFVMFGLVRSLRHRPYRWIALAYVVVLAIYTIDASSDGALKHFVSGFWYTDYTRTGAMVALFSIPLAAYGFAWAVDACAGWIEGQFRNEVIQRAALPLSAATLALVFGVSLFVAPRLYLYSTYSLPSGLGKIEQQIRTRYSWDNGLTGEEAAFIKQVEEVVPEGALIINVPSDGSSWSYGTEGLHVLYRRSADVGGTATPEESAIVRTQLCDIAASPEVRDVVKRLGAKYVMILDDKTGDSRTVSKLRYTPEKWYGIESITPETPGFRLLLSEGDMRLYEIED